MAESGQALRLPPVYYGTIDATPLWICLLHDAWKAGLPDAEVEELLPNLLDALEWLRDHGDLDGDGFLEYLDESGTGLVNQGWKDSGDAIRWHDGSLAKGPIALAEVQAYAYEAAMVGAEILEAFGRPGAAEWRHYAAGMAERFRAQFWCEDELGPYPALALDADKRPVDGVTSNMGHLLGTGILNEEEQLIVVRRVMDPTMFSGYGVRTLSTTNGGYWPTRYHAGAVWSHDTALIISGMLADGFPDEAAQLAAGLLQVAEANDWRLPELFGGHGSDTMRTPVPFPASCRPQAWASASSVVIAAALTPRGAGAGEAPAVLRHQRRTVTGRRTVMRLLAGNPVDRYDGQETPAQDLGCPGVGADDGVVAAQRLRLGGVRGCFGRVAFAGTGGSGLAGSAAAASPAVPGLTVAWPCSRTPNWPSNTGWARFLESSMMDVYPLNAPFRVITLRSRMSPVGSALAVSASPENRNGRYFSSGCSAPSTVRSRSSPSITVSTRSMPGKAEKAPALDTSAMLTRQSQAPSWAEAAFGWLASSRVTPPLLRHGSALSSA